MSIENLSREEYLPAEATFSGRMEVVKITILKLKKSFKKDSHVIAMLAMF